MGIDMVNSAMPAAEVVSPDKLPFASPEETFIKIHASRRRTSKHKFLHDIGDPGFIAGMLPVLHVVSDPPELVVDFLIEFLPRSIHVWEWWLEKLGISYSSRVNGSKVTASNRSFTDTLIPLQPATWQQMRQQQ